MAESPINVDRQWFNLSAEPDRIDTAATSWTTLGTAGDDAGDDLNTAATTVYDDPWEGDIREAYQRHQAKLRDTSTDMVKAAKPINVALGNIASALRSKQGDLTSLETEITGAVACTIGDNQLNFRPKTPAESQQVLAAVSTARGIRADLDTTLGEEESKLSKAVAAWTDMSTYWRQIADGGIEGAFALPPESTDGGSITLPDGTVVVNTGDGDDSVKVSTKADGTVVVTVNGESTEYPPGTEVVLRTGGGNDTVDVSMVADTGVTVVSGDGNDTVNAGDGPFGLASDNSHNVISGAGNDTVHLGDGNNRVSTGGGDDSVELGNGDNNIATGGGDDTVDDGGFLDQGGAGNNTISTGRGNDTAHTGSGNDHIYTGEGDDVVRGGGGNDVIAGGEGKDEIYGEDGRDHVYGGDGRDYVDGGDGGDHVYGGQGDDVLYGMGGNDYMYGGQGSDYVEGAKGDDYVEGGTGSDMLSGGRGDDRVQGGDGDDVMYAGHGEDYVNGGDGFDNGYIQDGEDTSSSETYSQNVDIADHGFINIDQGASDEFRDRTEADLDMLASSPTGQQGIEHLRDHRDPNAWGGNHEVTIYETDGGNAAGGRDGNIWGNKDSHIDYNPSKLESTTERPPVVGLYHELAHVNTYWDGSYDGDQVGGTGPDASISQAERQATGLPTDGSAYDPGNPQDNLELDYDLTENGLRDELGLKPRETYT